MKGLFLSSRKLARDDRGFSLVELIVVIAIMAILASVGTAGYSKYMKASNKGADKTLVGNVMRAIETGTYSTMFNLDDSMIVGGISYPVGYVVLSTDSNAQSNASSVQAREVSGKCAFADVTVIAVEKTMKSYSCDTFLCSGKEDGYVHTSSSVRVRYCTTHSKNQPITLTEDTKYATNYTIQHSGSWKPTHSLKPSGEFSLPAGSYVAENGTSQLYEEYSNGTCVFAANNGVVAGDIVTDGEGKNPIYEALVAAFGEGMPGTNLKYDGWTSDDGVNYATFLNNTGEMIASVQDTYGTLDTMVGVIERLNAAYITNINTSNYLSGDYADASELLESFAGHMVEKHPNEEAFMTAWNGASTYAGVDYTYGLTDADKYHHDYIYSATKTYNQCFASYCEANGVSPTYTAAILNFTSTPNESGLSDITLLNTIPRTVNLAAFAGVTGVNTSYTLQQKFRDISSNDTDTQADAAFEQCKKLYQSYIDNSNGSSPCEKNGETFYDLMNTMDKTAGAARDAANVSGGDFFGYYNNYLSAMSAIYSGVETAVKEGNVVILVTVKDGIVECEVSPAAANPRND